MKVKKRNFHFVAIIFAAVFTVNAQSLPFFDNFDDNDDNGWIKLEGGNWNVEDSIYTKDAVAMSYDGHYISYVGDNTWTDYTVSVNAYAVDDTKGWASLVFRIQDSANYYTFQIEPATNCVKIEKRTDFTYTVLQAETLSLSSKTWYELKVRVIGNYAYCYIDNALVFSYKGIQILSGGAGLASWHMNSQFDNFSATAICTSDVITLSLPFYEDFNNNNDDRWIKPEGGNWVAVDSVYTKDSVSTSYDGHYISYVGDSTWVDYVVSVKARTIDTIDSSTGWASLIFRTLDDGTYYTFQIEPATNSTKLERRTDHSYTILEETTSFTLSSNTWYNLKVKVRGDSAYCYIDSSLVFTYKGILIPSGGAGLASWHINSQFDDFSVVAVNDEAFLVDKFSYSNDSGWTKPAGGNWKVNTGVYTIDSTSSTIDGHCISYRGDSLWKDYTVSVDARSNDTTSGWLSLIVRVQDSTDSIYKYYAFQIDPLTNSGRFGIFFNNEFTTISKRNDLCLTNKRWYNLRAHVSGDSVICFLDNNQIFSIDDILIPSGGTGLASFHAKADYDNFNIERLSLFGSTPVTSVSKKTRQSISAFTYSSRLMYSLPSECHVSLQYYDLQGHCIASLVNSIQRSGQHSVAYPKNIAAGNYLLILKAGKQELKKQIMISK